MNYRYPLPERLAAQSALFEEFSNGGAQCHAQLQDGSVYDGLLISNATAIIAMRGHEQLPFALESIAVLFQTDDDRNPHQHAGWAFFDKWA